MKKEISVEVLSTDGRRVYKFINETKYRCRSCDQKFNSLSEAVVHLCKSTKIKEKEDN